ncbi:MAG: FecR domain-containing protein [Bacteroides sp.]|nr:FecR domain-containing protein [Bacteroides sp.]
MEEKHIDRLCSNLSEETTSGEAKAFQQWRAEKDHEQLCQLLEALRLNNRIEEKAEELRPVILADIHRRMDNENKRTGKTRRLLTIAASVAILIIGGGLGWFYGFSQPNEWMQVSCAMGVHQTLQLPDGSTVTLNGGTTLSYPQQFGKKIREVRLQGEAFFDVQHDPGKPFVVYSEEIRVKVLGTRFNVEAYPNEESVTVTLESGKVAVCPEGSQVECILQPDQQAIFNKETRQLKRAQANVTQATGWIVNDLYFHSTPLKDIVRKLERQFNVRFRITSESLANTPYTCDFTDDESLETILAVFALDKRFKYRQERGEYVIYE